MSYISQNRLSKQKQCVSNATASADDDAEVQMPRFSNGQSLANQHPFRYPGILTKTLWQHINWMPKTLLEKK